MDIPKEITLKEWSAYLPYGLKFATKRGYDTLSTLSEDMINCDFEEYYSLNEVKPILRDFSDLTKEIEHDGEKFVPIERLLDIESGINWSSSDYLLAESGVGEYWVKLKGKKKSFVFGFNCYKKYFYMHSQFGDNKSVKNQLQLFNRLFEWKFNVFQLPDESIVKVTEDFNPYK